MTRDEIIRMAREIGLEHREAAEELNSPYCDGIYLDDLERFAALVAKHAVSNIDPASWMSWQEGYAAGAAAEREACAQAARTAMLGAEWSLTERVMRVIRARGEKK